MPSCKCHPARAILPCSILSVPSCLCCPAPSGHAPPPSLHPSSPEHRAHSLLTQQCPQGAIPKGARGAPGTSVATAAPGRAPAPGRGSHGSALAAAARSWARPRRAAADSAAPRWEKEAGLSAGFSSSSVLDLWQLSARQRARALRWPRPPRRVKSSVLRTCSWLSKPARALAQWQHPDLGARHPAAPGGCLTGLRGLLPQQRHVPALPAALHRKSERAGGEIIQSRAEKKKSLNLISVGHGHNQISPARRNIVSMFPQAG